MTHNITDKLISLAYSIDDFVEDPENARHHNDKSIDAIAESLHKFGQRMPIIVRADTMTVTAGNGRLRAARKLGWTKIAAVIVDEDKKTATAYALADNKTAEISEWDDEALANALSFLKSEDESLLHATAFDDADITKLLAMSGDLVSLDFDDEEDVNDLNKSDTQTAKKDSIKFKKHSIALTDAQAERLDAALTAYRKDNDDFSAVIEQIIVYLK